MAGKERIPGHADVRHRRALLPAVVAFPAYPVGAFSYSSGLEWAVENWRHQRCRYSAELVARARVARQRLLRRRVFVQAHAAERAQDDTALRAVAELASAFASSRERHLETDRPRAVRFVDATLAAWPCAALERLRAIWPKPVAYPVTQSRSRRRGMASRSRRRCTPTCTP